MVWLQILRSAQTSDATIAKFQLQSFPLLFCVSSEQAGSLYSLPTQFAVLCTHLAHVLSVILESHLHKFSALNE